jgi:4-aminobutyrate aminotransferase
MAKEFIHKIGPKSQQYLDRDAKVVSPSYTRDYPFVMSHGIGSEVWDVDGNRYIDMTTGIAVNSTGHSHPTVVQAIKDQADKFIHMAGTDFYYDVQISLAERLAEIAPFEEDARIFFANSGTEAIEGALKLARYHTSRPQFIGFFKSFHGRTMGSLAATSSKPTQRAGYFPMMSGFTHIPYPDAYRPILNMDGYADYGERIIDYLEKTIFQTIVPAKEVASNPSRAKGATLSRLPVFSPRFVNCAISTVFSSLSMKCNRGLAAPANGGGLNTSGSNPILCVVPRGLPVACRSARLSPAIPS